MGQANFATVGIELKWQTNTGPGGWPACGDRSAVLVACQRLAAFDGCRQLECVWRRTKKLRPSAATTAEPRHRTSRNEFEQYETMRRSSLYIYIYI